MATSTSSPSKKSLTEGVKTIIDASNAYRDAIIPEELNQRLQNIGMRVRKSVMEGYNTDKLAVPQSVTVPPTPPCSPAKPLSANAQPTTSTRVFLTANDAFNSTFFPMGSPPTPAQSPRKRSRAEEEGDLNVMERHSPEEDAMTDRQDEDEVEDSDDMAVSEANARTPSRKIKPLRATPGNRLLNQGNLDFADPFVLAGQAARSMDAPSLLPATSADDVQGDSMMGIRIDEDD